MLVQGPDTHIKCCPPKFLCGQNISSSLVCDDFQFVRFEFEGWQVWMQEEIGEWN